jgi:hypothetical protein
LGKNSAVAIGADGQERQPSSPLTAGVAAIAAARYYDLLDQMDEDARAGRDVCIMFAQRGIHAPSHIATLRVDRSQIRFDRFPRHVGRMLTVAVRSKRHGG